MRIRGVIKIKLLAKYLIPNHMGDHRQHVRIAVVMAQLYFRLRSSYNSASQFNYHQRA